MKSIYILLSIIALSFATYACEGDEGPAGPAGAANIVSEEFTFVASDVQQTSNTSFIAQHSTDALSAEIVNEGVVLGYMQLDNIWTLLPFAFEGADLTFSFGAGFFNVELYGPDADETTGIFTNVRYRMVAIPPEEVNPSLNYDDYDAVAREYGLINSDFQQ